MAFKRRIQIAFDAENCKSYQTLFHFNARGDISACSARSLRFFIPIKVQLFV